jgi:hypothetical protein
MKYPRWLSLEGAARELGEVEIEDVQVLIDADELRVTKFPSGVKVDRQSLLSLSKAMRRGYVPRVARAHHLVGPIALTSGCNALVCIGSGRVTPFFSGVPTEEDPRELGEHVFAMEVKTK